MCPNALLWAGFLAEIRRKSRVHISIRMVGSQTHVQSSMNMHKGRWLNENWSSIIGPHTKELWVQFSQGQVPGLAGSISALIGARVGGNQSICLSHINASLSLSFSLSSLSLPLPSLPQKINGKKHMYINITGAQSQSWPWEQKSPPDKATSSREGLVLAHAMKWHLSLSCFHHNGWRDTIWCPINISFSQSI